jgi:SAM-dependent methyltransferase
MHNTHGIGSDDDDELEPASVDAAQRDALLAALANEANTFLLSENSLAPYAPTVAPRRMLALRAARVTSSDVVYDLGSGKGDVLLDAARTFGCRCVGLEWRHALVEEARARARKAGKDIDALCTFVACDLTALDANVLRQGRFIADAPKPTVAFAWLTSGGLKSFSKTLKRAWSSGRFRIVTCVDALDTARDILNDGIFHEHDDEKPTNEDAWDVVRDDTYAKFGVYVTPERGVSIEDWSKAEPPAEDTRRLTA